MPTTMCQTDSPRFTGLFPYWDKPRPIRFYLMENLLESRMGSLFPTSCAGFDEDVNVYISHLLAGFLRNHFNPQIKMGAGPLLEPPAKSLPLGSQVEFYRADADHRLLFLGLMNRGDDLRRRRNPLHGNESDTRKRDLIVGSTCFEMAANLLQHGPHGQSGLAVVMRKLAENFTDYVQVIANLATNNLNLGARLTDNDLQRLLQDVQQGAEDIPTTPEPKTTDKTFTMDDLLDMLLAQKQDPQPMRQHLINDMARQLEVTGHLLLND